MKLTHAQKHALATIRAHGYAVSIIFSDRAFYTCAGERLQYRVVEALRRARLVKGVAVPTRQTLYGYTNQLRTTSHIVVPTEVVNAHQQ